ncbi:hypothetical protein SDC9_112876 [bioreactor metagenome]|uniref:Uncharacterized protein n=1 Tax=bioreactor metagenome TaxID=1076179 RepID=A0A645BLA8_9ZZZZ
MVHPLRTTHGQSNTARQEAKRNASKRIRNAAPNNQGRGGWNHSPNNKPPAKPKATPTKGLGVMLRIRAERSKKCNRPHKELIHSLPINQVVQLAVIIASAASFSPTQNQFSLTHAAPSTIDRTKSRFPSVYLP